ncbi:hypothetical protein BUE93_08610 [Chromobacterium amazonense]|uniref:Hypervirulence associated protein TUDOR domain-containing protein n=2 Tax=Chromobacterium amazonense TaxID=1382803 RepID=A0A2S9X5P9_9NEIS|nr:hypothetical protein BUE93_08610 [Chromobacterium amazonense]
MNMQVGQQVKFTTSGGRGAARSGQGVLQEIKSSTKGKFYGVKEEGKEKLTFVRESQLRRAA